MSKEPKYKGIKKGYSAIWLGEDTDDASGSTIRIQTSKGNWCWDYAHEFPRRFNYSCVPCWNVSFGAIILTGDPIKRMREYDKADDRETIFLGYVKDFE